MFDFDPSRRNIRFWGKLLTILYRVRVFYFKPRGYIVALRYSAQSAQHWICGCAKSPVQTSAGELGHFAIAIFFVLAQFSFLEFPVFSVQRHHSVVNKLRRLSAMDPLSVLSLVEACAGLAVTAGKLAIGLKSLADSYRSSALMFRSLSTQCKLFATAVRAIQAWMEEAPETSNIDDRIWEQLADSLECANDAIYALENELVSTSKSSINTFWDKVGVVWNLDGLKELQDCIHKQITGLGVILQIMNLPTRKCQTDGLVEQNSVFQESRSSAMSVRDPETSTIRGGGDATSTICAPSTILTTLSQMPKFDFEEMLLSSQVYLRNRNKTLALNSTTSSNPGKMKDAGTVVGAWDLPPKYGIGRSLHEEFESVRSGSREELAEFMEQVVARQEPLQTKYSKVKRLYFDKAAEVDQLQKRVEDLIAQGSQRNEGDIRLSDTLEKQKYENEKLRKQAEWYRVQLSYWNESSSRSNGSVASAATTYSRSPS
jgi:hypothetical protein